MVSRVGFLAGVFFLFSCMGFITLMINPIQMKAWQVVTAVLLSGGGAIIYAWAGMTRRVWLYAILGVLQTSAFIALGQTYANNKMLVDASSPLRRQLGIFGTAGIITLIAGYSLFIFFFSREGSRYVRAHTEITLAQEIHRALVPPIERTIGNFSIYGASFPSGEVGGDLVDLVESGSWTAYVADVSGHGVSAGVLMAMFKTAVRTRALGDGSTNAMLNEVHRALYPLKTANLFVTAGVLHCDFAGKLTLSMAGHPPLLHYRNATGTVEEVASQDLPLGILPQQLFQTCGVTADRGDLLVLLTDGLTEVFDAKKNEMGLEPVKTSLRANATRSLPEIFTAIREVALKFGKQDDDQTMLLIRVN